MYSFAHMADVHLGAYSRPEMEELESKVFAKALSDCVEANVDFILISGDLFHSNAPARLKVVKLAVAKMRWVTEQGIPIYVIFGNHDHSATSTSLIEVIESAGLLRNISVLDYADDDKLKLHPVEDEKTGAKLTGMSAMKRGLEREYYKQLDRDDLQRLDGFKIFAFHSAITELVPYNLRNLETISLSLLPKGFSYYAGGHVHQNSISSPSDYENIVFPGPLFTGYGRDLEMTAQMAARGEFRGFYLVKFEEEVKSINFVETNLSQCIYCPHNLSGLTAREAQIQLSEGLETLDVKGKIVVLKVWGQLSSGNIYDIPFKKLTTLLTDNGATYVDFNRAGLMAQEYIPVQKSGLDRSEVEEDLFKEQIGAFKANIPNLQSTPGIKLSIELLKSTRREKREGETVLEYEKSILENALELFDLKGIYQD